MSTCLYCERPCPLLDSERFLLQYILNDKEVEVKTELWMKQNAEYLKEQKGQDIPPHRPQMHQPPTSSLHLLHGNKKRFY